MTAVRESTDEALPGATRPLPVLLGAAHLGPGVAVTTLVALLCVAARLGLAPSLLVIGGVLAGQLTIGWGNDLVDAARDRAVGRAGKPLADGRLSPALVVRCLMAAAVACVVLSLLAGWRSGLVHLGIGVASGHAYNLLLKRTAWSWLPYALAFGSLPAVVTLAGPSPAGPPAWTVATAALLGVGAHFLNTLPDLADDAATGVRGLPHRLGAAPTRIGGALLLVGGSVVAVLGPDGTPPPGALVALGLVAALGVVALTGTGRVPFAAAVLIALVDVVLLTAASR
ncbi:MAG: UbiA family prenyltransferase [Marmoricola sp.]